MQNQWELADITQTEQVQQLIAALLAPEPNVFPITFMINNTKMSFSMAVSANTSIGDVKAMIHDMHGILPDQMRLNFRGKFMDDYVRIGAYGVKGGDVVYMVPQNNQPSKQLINQTNNQSTIRC